MTALKVARGFTLPLDIVTRKTAILAKSGAGKSNTAKVIVEGVLNAGAQVVILDPVGHWWGLRSLFAIPVLGGMNGDIPLDPLAGKLIADVAAESGQSLILDVSLMDSDGEMQRFAYDFAERFYKQKQLHPTAVLIVLEEADEFAPQDTRGANVPRMVGAWARIAKRGRGRGIGLLSVTLRSAALSKNVLNQSDGIVAMRTTAPLDIKAVEEWVSATRAIGADAVIPSLPGLETGEAWFWIPEYGVLQRVKVLKARSLDTSATPEVGAKLPEAKKLKPIDLTALGERMQSTVERAKENDPAELRKQLRAHRERADAAERTLANIHELEQRTPEPQTVDRPVPIVDPELVDRIEDALREAKRLGEELKAAGSALRQAADDNTIALHRTLDELKEGTWNTASTPSSSSRTGSGTSAAASATSPAPSSAAARAAIDRSPAGGGPGARVASSTPKAEGVTGAAAAVLAALAQFPEGRTKRQLAGLTGYRATGSTMRGALAELRKRGYCTPAGSGELILATPYGIAAAGDVAPVPTGAALYAYWREKLGGASRAVFDLLYANPAGLERDTIAVETGYEPTGSTMRGALAELRKYDLITQAGVEPIHVLDTLYE